MKIDKEAFIACGKIAFFVCEFQLPPEYLSEESLRLFRLCWSSAVSGLVSHYKKAAPLYRVLSSQDNCTYYLVSRFSFVPLVSCSVTEVTPDCFKVIV